MQFKKIALWFVPQMLPRENRLVKDSEIRMVMSKGKTLQAKYFTIKSLDQPGSSSRVAIITSKKIAKQAVRRNKARRQLREALRPDIKSLKGKDLVFLIRREMLEAKYSDILDDVHASLQKLIWSR